jgi:hypothetical protein
MALRMQGGTGLMPCEWIRYDFKRTYRDKKNQSSKDGLNKSTAKLNRLFYYYVLIKVGGNVNSSSRAPVPDVSLTEEH